MLTAQPSPTAVPQPVLNIDRRVVIAIEHKTAVGARMNANAECLVNDSTAADYYRKNAKAESQAFIRRHTRVLMPPILS